MPAEVVVTADCASLFGIYQVPSDSDPAKTYKVQIHGETWMHCACKSFEFSPEGEKTCKHCERVWDGICKYNINWSEGNRAPAYRPVGYTTGDIVTGKTCPACGGPMVAVRRAV